MAKAKAAMAEFRAKKDAARKARAAARQASSRTPLKPVSQKAKHKARYETPKKKKVTVVAEPPIAAPKSGRFAKKLDFHTKHESNYFDDHEWKADLASEDEAISFDLRKRDNTTGGFRVPSLPPRKRLSLASQSATSSGRSTPVNVDSPRAAAKKRRRRLADGTWSLRRDGEMFSDDDDEYDSDVERDGYPQRMRRRVGRDTFGDVWKYSRKRRRKTSAKKQQPALTELDFKEEELVTAEPKSLDDANMAYFSGLPVHPTLPYSPTERIAVPTELVYDERGNIPGSLDAMSDDEAKESWGLVFGRDYQPSNTIPDLSDIPGVKPVQHEEAQSPSSRAVALYSPLNLEEIYEKEQSKKSDTTSAASWSPFGIFSSVASWASSWFKSTPEAQTPIAAAA